MGTYGVRFLLFCLAAVTLTGCWDDRHRVSDAVWSDDDQGQAWVEHQYERKAASHAGLDGDDTRNHSFRIWVRDADGSNARALTDWQDGEPTDGLYYMRTQGYVVLTHTADDTRTVTAVPTGPGAPQDLASGDAGHPCGELSGLPSEDGTLIAIIGREGTANVAANCAAFSARVQFFDGETFEPAGAVRFPAPGLLTTAWDGESLALWDGRGNAWRATPAGIEMGSRPECTWPATSSSQLSRDGALIAPGTPEDPISDEGLGQIPCR